MFVRGLAIGLAVMALASCFNPPVHQYSVPVKRRPIIRDDAVTLVPVGAASNTSTLNLQNSEIAGKAWVTNSIGRSSQLGACNAIWFDLTSLRGEEVTAASLSLTRFKSSGTHRACLFMLDTEVNGKDPQGVLEEVRKMRRIQFDHKAARNRIARNPDQGEGILFAQSSFRGGKDVFDITPLVQDALLRRDFDLVLYFEWDSSASETAEIPAPGESEHCSVAWHMSGNGEPVLDIELAKPQASKNRGSTTSKTPSREKPIGYFQEDFSDPTHDWTWAGNGVSIWPATSTEPGELFVGEGAGFFVEGEERDGTLAITIYPDWTDSTLDEQVFEVYFRYTDDDNHYKLQFRAGRLFRLGKRVNGKWQALKATPTGGYLPIKDQGLLDGVQTIELTLNGERIQASLNGKPLCDTRDRTLQTGGIGFHTSMQLSTHIEQLSWMPTN